MDQVLANGAAAAEQIRSMSAEFQALATDLRAQTKAVGADAGQSIIALRQAADQVTQVASQLDLMIAENREPIHDFASTGLYEMTQVMTEKIGRGSCRERGGKYGYIYGCGGSL